MGLCLLGPTASGKSEVAFGILKWAQEQGLALHPISVDSVSVYRHLDIGSGKPSKAQLLQYPHGLIDCCALDEIYSVGRFVKELVQEIKQAKAAGAIPLLVGGSMQYFMVLYKGWQATTGRSEEIRKDLQAQLSSEGVLALYDKLLELDPKRAAGIDPADTVRIVRALEICLSSTEKPANLIEDQDNQAVLASMQWLSVGLNLDRSVLLERIKLRMTMMFNQGWAREIEHLVQWYKDSQYANLPLADANLPWLRAVGYKQLMEQALAGKPLNEVEENILIATNRLAKKQRTWLRSFSHYIELVDSTEQASQHLKTQLEGLL